MNIQELLIKKGHKDLADEYNKKLARVLGTYTLSIPSGKEFKFTKHDKMMMFLRKNKGKYDKIKMTYVPKKVD